MKQVLITGASRGIGAAIARKFAKEGMSLTITGFHDREALQKLQEEIENNFSVACRSYVCDMGDFASVEKMFAQIPAPDILINNAGISYFGLLSDMSIADWHTVLNTNLNAAFYTSKLAIPHMVHEKWGKIINISSVWGNVGASMEVAYSVSKGGINALTKALAKELAPSNIQVNAIAPGMIDTAMNHILSSGTIVKRASLHNEDIIRQLDIHEGDYLYVEKGGEIIPKIVGVDTSRRKPDSSPIEFVRTCPVCGTSLTRVEGEAAWVCPNKYGCKPQITGRIEHFVARHAMNIDGIGEEVAVQLFDSGMVKNVADLYSLTGNRLLCLEHFQQKAASRILNGIRKSLEVPFERVLFAIGIPFVGETTAKVLARNVHTIDRLMQMTALELSSIPEIGPKIADSIVDFFANPDNVTIIERLREAGVQLCLSEEELANRTNLLEGKKIVISGVFARHSREEYKAMIEQNGGKNVSSISAATSYVLAGDNMGPAKLEKARKLSIPIINEEEFLAMLHPE